MKHQFAIFHRTMRMVATLFYAFMFLLCMVSLFNGYSLATGEYLGYLGYLFLICVSLYSLSVVWDGIGELYATRTQKSSSPVFGKLILCGFLPPDKQEDRLADFDEMLNTVWIPHFGRRVGRLVYVWNAFKSAGAIVWIGVMAAIADRIARKLGL